MKKKLLTLTFFISTLVLAQENQTVKSIEKLSLKSAIDYALINNPEINRLKEHVTVKNGEWWNSFGFSDPQLNYEKEGINKNIKDSFAEQKWKLQQTIDFPFTTYYRLSRIADEKNALEEKLNHNKKELIAEVKLKYIDVLYSLRILDLRKKQIDLAEDLKNATTSKLEAGDISELELMKSQIQLAEAENLYEGANQLHHEARYILFNKIGLDPSLQKYSIEFDDTLHIANKYITQDMFLKNLDKQSLILSYSNSVEATSAGVYEAWSSFLPELSFSYFYQDFGTGYDYRGFEVGVSLPIWFLFNQNGSIQVAKAKQREVEWSLKEIKLNIKTEIENAWHGYEASKSKIKKYESTIRSLADEFQKLTLIGYQLGEIDLLRLIDAQQTYLNSEINYYSALKDYYQHIISLEKYFDEELIFFESSENTLK